jgi:5-methylcytosine-specific restriction endonuclease McrA
MFLALWRGGASRDRFCSSACRRRSGRRGYKRRNPDRVADERRQRRARKKKAFRGRVYTKQVYERDNWRCQLCGKKVRRSVVVPHPLAPVLDHIVPLAVGGAHEMANVQCAHFLCNSRKGMAAMNDQLRLLG